MAHAGRAYSRAPCSRQQARASTDRARAKPARNQRRAAARSAGVTEDLSSPRAAGPFLGSASLGGFDKTQMALRRTCCNSEIELREAAASAPFLEEATNSICSRSPCLASLGLSSIHRHHDKISNNRAPIPSEG